MCGIVGIATAEGNGFQYKELEAFETMLFLDTLRGWDSTGVFGVTNDKDVFIAKEACHGPDFIKKTEYKDLRSRMSARGKFFVGHNRAATRGEVSDKNAHPFWVDDKIVLVQNGTYKGNHKQHKDVEVDTEAIAHVIAENDDVEVALNKINASYALVWYNTKNSKLHIIRNSERPLWLARSKNGSIWWASESATLAYAAHRHDITWDEKPYAMKTDTLLTLEVKARHNFGVEEKALKIKPNVEVMPNFHGQNGYYGRSPTNYGRSGGNQAPFVHLMTGSGNAILDATRETVRQNQSTDDSGDRIEHTCAQILVDLFPKIHLTLDEGREALAALTEDSESTTPITVELEDYYAANDSRNCSVWHVFGRDVNPKHLNVVYHWVVKEEDEHKVLAMCSGNYYNVKQGTPHMRIFEKQGERKAIVTCYGLSAELLYQSNIARNILDHVH